MNVFGIGPLELALIMVIGVIFVGPERIPEVAVQVAKALRSVRSYATDATSQVRRELDELTKEYEDVRKELKEFRESVKKDTSALADAVSRVIEESPIIEPGGDPPKQTHDAGG